jgi:hypothetical protein
MGPYSLSFFRSDFKKAVLRVFISSSLGGILQPERQQHFPTAGRIIRIGYLSASSQSASYTPVPCGRAFLSRQSFKPAPVSLAPVLAYTQAVRAATDAALVALTAYELDRQVRFARRLLPVGAALIMLVVQIALYSIYRPVHARRTCRAQR